MEPTPLDRIQEPLTLAGVVAIGSAATMLVAFSTATNSLFWAPKVVGLLAAGGLGLPFAIWRALRGDRIARFGVVFAAAAALSAAFAPNTTLAVFGQYRQGTGLIFVVCLVGAWALGAELNARERRLLLWCVLACVGFNLVVGAAECLVDLSSFQLFLVDDRAAALMGNPIHAGALAAGAAAALAVLVFHDRRWLTAAVAAGALAQMSGSRSALLVVALAALWAVGRGLRLGLQFAAALVLGILIGAALLGAAHATSATTRLGEGESGVTPRVENWWSARHAVADRPLLGSGPGTFGPATSRYRTLKGALAEGPERVFIDAHNLVVEYAVTTGVLGVVTLLLFLAAAILGARGPTMAFALGLLAVHLVEPQFVGTTPVALLCLGAGSQAVRPGTVGGARLAAIGGLAVGVAAAAVFLVGDTSLRRSELDFRLADASRANRLLPRWTTTADQMAKLETFASLSTRDASHAERALRWREEATRRDPTEAYSWQLLGEQLLTRGDPSSAATAFRGALRANPQSLKAFEGLGQADLLLGDKAGAVHNVQEALRRARDPADRRRLEGLLAKARA